MYNETKRFAVLQLIGTGHEVVKAHFTHHVKLFYCEIPSAVLEDFLIASDDLWHVLTTKHIAQIPPIDH